MNIRLGTLNIVPALEHLEFVGKPVAEALRILPNTAEIGVAKIDPSFSDTAAFSAHYEVSMDQAVNCIILEAKRDDRRWFVACVIGGNTRADVNGLIRRTLDARRVSFASMEQAVRETNMEYGAITPVGLPEDWLILIDQTVTNSLRVVIGSGVRNSKLIVPGLFLASLPNATVLENMAQPFTDKK